MTESALPILLGLASAITLAVANVAVKRSGDILTTRAAMSVWSALLIAPAAFVVPLPDAATFAALSLSVPAHWAYQGALVRSMHRGDLSLVFPVMRGAAPILVAVAGMLVLDERLSPVELAGVLIASAGVVSFAWPPGGARRHTRPDAVALIWAALTAVCIALYMVLDARGVRAAPTPWTYIVWLFLLDWVGITAVTLYARGGELVASVRAQWRYGLAAGVLSILSFSALLYGLSLTEAVRISALRETAVVFAAVLGWLFLKESFGLRRVIAASVVTCGLALMQLG